MQLCKNPISCWKNKKPYELILLVLSVHSLNFQRPWTKVSKLSSSKSDGCNKNVDSATNNKKSDMGTKPQLNYEKDDRNWQMGSLFGKSIGWILELTVKIELIGWSRDFDTFKISPQRYYTSRMAKMQD
jgi:hypothetical protein